MFVGVLTLAQYCFRFLSMIMIVGVCVSVIDTDYLSGMFVLNFTNEMLFVFGKIFLFVMKVFPCFWLGNFTSNANWSNFFYTKKNEILRSELCKSQEGGRKIIFFFLLVSEAVDEMF